jgi:hypothetical protein
MKEDRRIAAFRCIGLRTVIQLALTTANVEVMSPYIAQTIFRRPQMIAGADSVKRSYRFSQAASCLRMMRWIRLPVASIRSTVKPGELLLRLVACE